MNRFNDPVDFKAADAVIEEMLKLENGEVTTTAALFEKIAPNWEEQDLDLTGIDTEVRRKAAQKKISLITIPEFREWATEKSYNIPFKVYKR